MNKTDSYRQGCQSALCGALIVVMGAALAGCGPADAPVQSDRRPFQFGIVDTVKQAGSDGKSKRFEREVLAKATRLASESFTADVIVRRFSELVLDPGRLDLVERTKVRVYFIGEASGYNNALGINTKGVGVHEGNPKLIFPHPYTAVNLYDAPALIDPETNQLDASRLGERSDENAVIPGDFVDLGTLAAGTKLSFFLIADDRQGNVNVYTPLPEQNPDGLAHMVAIAMPDSPYLILSFEDMYQGGDRDFSDCVFAVEMSAYNIQAMLGRIDPWRQAKRIALFALIIGVPTGGPLLFFAIRRRIRKARARKALDEAERLLAASQPEKAVAILERARLACDGKDRERIEGLAVTGYEHLGDVAGLWMMYRESAGVFEQRESASLQVARAQIETDHVEDYSELRGKWYERAGMPERWLALDADTLRKQGRARDALALLKGSPNHSETASLLAREALLCVANSPDTARTLIERAVQMEPANAEVRVFQGAVIEHLGDRREAEPAYHSALALSPKDPFIRDAAGDFHRRQGTLRDAVDTWRDGLQYPSMDFVWLRVLFWSRVAYPVDVEWKTLKPPPGDLLPLIDFLRQLDSGQFWDAARFEPVAQTHPHLLARQEAFWLRLLQALKKGREDEALSLLNLSRFGERSWYEELEVALLRILQFRRLGFMDPQLVGHVKKSHVRHPLFAALDAWVRGEDAEGLPALQRLIQTEEIFSATLLAAGWSEAGLQLRRIPLVPGQFPRWFVDDVLNALRRNRGEEKAQEFANEQGI